MAKKPRIIGQLLIDSGKLDKTTLDAALEEQAQTGVRLGETLLRRHALRAVDVARALATQLGLRVGATASDLIGQDGLVGHVGKINMTAGMCSNFQHVGGCLSQLRPIGQSELPRVIVFRLDPKARDNGSLSLIIG